MKKNLLLILIAVLAITFTACKNNKKANNESETADMHNAQNAIDWPGSYYGVLPCASCPGINTMITLNEDGTYEKTVEYQECDDTPETTKGSFTWDETGSIITLGESTYKVGENQLFALDADNKVIEGELAKDYILTKTQLEAEPDVNEGPTPQSFTGDDEKEYNILFDTNPTPPTATVESGNFNVILTQTAASAKSAEYEGENSKLSVNGDKGTLTINNKKIALKAK